MIPNTAFYFDMSKVQGRDQTNFQMMKGSLGLKVAKLGGSESVAVKTESTAMGVRGTDFEVVIVPDSSVLVLCAEGEVAVTDSRSGEVSAKPGTVVEKVPNEKMKGYAVDVKDLPVYREYWTSQDWRFSNQVQMFLCLLTQKTMKSFQSALKPATAKC